MFPVTPSTLLPTKNTGAELGPPCIAAMGVTLTSSRIVPPIPVERWPEKANTVLVDVAVELKRYGT